MLLLANGVVIAIVAHGLIGASLVWDKVLLQRREYGPRISVTPSSEA
ncbi:MAG TPA: hypothetical protein VKU01_09665 [Bryobacteraceae bacterium]|nr:hypothetical protein [Bryobacteraceae bacterium]